MDASAEDNRHARRLPAAGIDLFGGRDPGVVPVDAKMNECRACQCGQQRSNGDEENAAATCHQFIACPGSPEFQSGVIKLSPGSHCQAADNSSRAPGPAAMPGAILR